MRKFKPVQSSQSLPFRSLNGAIFMLIGVLLFTLSLLLELLPLLLWSAFMMALVILLIISLAIIYPFLMQKVRLIELHLPVYSDKNYSATEMTIKIPSKLLYFFLFFYELEILWQDLPYKSYSFIYQLKNKKVQNIQLNYPVRGTYLVIAKLKILDIFGFFALELNLPLKQRFLIPATLKNGLQYTFNLPQIHQLTNNNIIYSSNKINNSNNEFYDFKPYVIGDDVRTLDWRLFARFQELFIKRTRSLASNGSTFFLELVIPEPSYEGELILDKLISISQYLANFLMKSANQLTLHAGNSFTIVKYDGATFSQREKLAYISTKMNNSAVNSYRPGAILIMDNQQYYAINKSISYKNNYIIVVVQEQNDDLFQLQKEGSIIYFV